MIGRMVVGKFRADRIDEVIDLGRKAVAVLAERGPQGYQGYLSLVDRNTGKWVTIQLWDTEADATAWASNPLTRELLAPIMPLIVEPLVSEVLEVAIRT